MIHSSATFSAPACAARSACNMFTESSLIEMAQRGDADALNCIARNEMTRVERLLCRILGPRDDLDDQVQNVFVELCRALPRFRGDSKLSTFIGGITIRVAKRAMQPRNRTRRLMEPLSEYISPEPAPDTKIIGRARLDHTRKILEQLSEPKRVAFLLWALGGLPTQQIAEMMGASKSATRSRIFYAQKELRRKASKDPQLCDLVNELN
jgi:RNA polymerase sigma-70 factor, ECF subfamily